MLVDHKKNFRHFVAYYLFYSTRSCGIGEYPNADVTDLPESEENVL